MHLSQAFPLSMQYTTWCEYPSKPSSTIVSTINILSCLQALEENGEGRVLVVDGGGSKRCALLGDNIAEMGYKNGWSVSILLCVGSIARARCMS